MCLLAQSSCINGFALTKLLLILTCAAVAEASAQRVVPIRHFLHALAVELFSNSESGAFNFFIRLHVILYEPHPVLGTRLELVHVPGSVFDHTTDTTRVVPGAHIMGSW